MCRIFSSGWWLVENESKSLAWFPAPYLELWEGEEDDFAASQLGGMTHSNVSENRSGSFANYILSAVVRGLKLPVRG